MVRVRVRVRVRVMVTVTVRVGKQKILLLGRCSFLVCPPHRQLHVEQSHVLEPLVAAKVRTLRVIPLRRRHDAGGGEREKRKRAQYFDWLEFIFDQSMVHHF